MELMPYKVPIGLLETHGARHGALLATYLWLEIEAINATYHHLAFIQQFKKKLKEDYLK
jgi:hypothetical protein